MHCMFEAGLSSEITTTTTTTTIITTKIRAEAVQNTKDETSSACIVRKTNHTIDDCWKVQNKEKRNGTYQPKNKSDGNGNGNGKVAVVVGDNIYDGECLPVFAACVTRDDEWILDTACSFHICCNKDWFSSYEIVQTRDFVRAGNDNNILLALDLFRSRPIMK